MIFLRESMNKICLFLALLLGFQGSNAEDTISNLANFSLRLKLYSNCLRGKCTKQERSNLKEYIFADGAKVLLGLGLLTGASTAVGYGIFKIRKSRKTEGAEGSFPEENRIFKDAQLKRIFKDTNSENLTFKKVKRSNASHKQNSSVIFELAKDKLITKDDINAIATQLNKFSDKSYLEGIDIEQHENGHRIITIQSDGRILINDTKEELFETGLYDDLKQVGYINK